MNCPKCKNISDRKTGYCSVCMSVYDTERRKRPEFVDKRKQEYKKWRSALKLEVLQFYSGLKIPYCSCCGESEYWFLTIDHENGGGRKHRKEVGNSSLQFYAWLKRNNFPAGFTVLCFNCNCGRSLNHGICPHSQPKA